jgi:hypothetical protein
MVHIDKGNNDEHADERKPETCSRGKPEPAEHEEGKDAGDHLYHWIPDGYGIFAKFTFSRQYQVTNNWNIAVKRQRGIAIGTE